MEKLQNYINGELVAPISGEYFDNFEPATGKVYSLIPDSDLADVETATAAAKAAFPIWSRMSIQDRSDILLRIAQLIGDNLDELAQAESRDNGKPLKLARTVDIPRAQSNFHFYGTGILHFASESHSMAIWLLITPCAKQLVLPVVFLLGICLCICFHGKLLLH